MYTLLIVLIYLAFISLGLPDSLLGSAWPIMRFQINAPLDFAGVITMIITGSTIVSTMLSSKLIWRFKTGLVTAVSVLVSAISLFGFSNSHSIIEICLWAVPYGLGAGAIDTGLNNYVALHYSSKHMSWLHCFWGIGTTISPIIMASFISDNANWQGGYRCIAIIQIIIAAIMFVSLPLWKQNEDVNEEKNETPPLPLKDILKIDGVIFAILTFIGYCSCETTAGLWASSYLAEGRGANPNTAAQFTSFFYFGITFGRFINGFYANKFGDRRLIKIGIIVALIGMILMIIPAKTNVLLFAGLITTGFGCAPIFPSLIHATPDNFGENNTSSVISIQMTSAYIGSAFMPALFGVIARRIDIMLYPYYLLLSFVIMIIAISALYARRSRTIGE